MNDNSAHGLHVFVSGMVQGVFYRDYARTCAKQLNITGTANNISNGQVEIYAYGTKEDLDFFINDLKKGPRSAVVDDVQASQIPWQEYTGFKIVYY